VTGKIEPTNSESGTGEGISVRNRTEIESLQRVLDVMLDPINQVFLHSHMLRSWGHSLGLARHREWVEKMRRALPVVAALDARGAAPRSRESTNLDIGTNSREVLESDASQAREFIVEVKTALESFKSADETALLEDVLNSERKDLTRLESWCAGPQAREGAQNRKHLMPKPGGAQSAIDALDAVLPDMTAAVSQFFYYSLMYKARRETDLAARELDAAVTMMFRTQALLERLLDLGGIPGGAGHGRIDINEGKQAADETAIIAHRRIVAVLERALGTLDGIVDPMTHTLMDGVLRTEREQISIRKIRLG